MTRPTSNESAPYYFGYINLIQTDDIVPTLKSQLDDMKSFLDGITDEQSLHSYAPEKWTIRQVVNHINDTERVFFHRAFWFARGFGDALPGFDQDVAAAACAPNDMTWTSLKDEFSHIRSATISFFENLTLEAWSRSGIASDNPVTVNALAYIIAGHVAHHRNVLTERYLSEKS